MNQSFSSAARHVRGLTCGRPAAHLLSGPLEAELAASHQCSAWFTTAPTLGPAGAAMHPAGEWPNVALLRHLADQFSAIGSVHAALVLTRATYSLFPGNDDAVELAATLESRLADRGAVAPEWSLQLDAWELVSEHEFFLDDEDGAGPRLTQILGFEHPRGDRHGLMLVHDEAGYLHSLNLMDDLDDDLDKVRGAIRSNDPDRDLVECDRLLLADHIEAAIDETYAREFVPVRFDLESVAVFALLIKRIDCLHAAAASPIA